MVKFQLTKASASGNVACVTMVATCEVAVIHPPPPRLAPSLSRENDNLAAGESSPLTQKYGRRMTSAGSNSKDSEWAKVTHHLAHSPFHESNVHSEAGRQVYWSRSMAHKERIHQGLGAVAVQTGQTYD